MSSCRSSASSRARDRAATPREWDAEHHVPMDALRTLGALGLLGVIIPEEYGGAGLDYTALTLLVEELAAVRRRPVRRRRRARRAVRRAAAALRQRRAEGGVPAAAGDRRAARRLRADRARRRAPTPPRSGARATPSGDGWRIDGTKTWITNGGFADFFIVFARTGGPGPKGVSAFLVERRTALTRRRRSRSSACTPRPPPSWRLTASSAGRGPDRRRSTRALKIALATLDGGRITIAAQACGIARAAARPGRPVRAPSGRRSAARSRASRACSSRSPTSPRGSRGRGC